MPGNGPLRCAQGDKGRRLLSSQLALDRDGLILLSRDVAFLERVVAASGTRDLYAELIPARSATPSSPPRAGSASRPSATNAVVMAHPEDWARHRLLRAIHLNTTLSELDGGRRSGGQAVSMIDRPTARPPDRPRLLAPPRRRHRPPLPRLPRGGARRPRSIAERCRYRIPIGRIVAPRLAEPDESFQRLRALAYAGAERRYGTVAPVTRERLERELRIIGQKGFADYFLVVKNIVEHGPTHCGRGSVANSIVSYCSASPTSSRSAPGSSSSASSIPSARIRPTSTSTSPGTSATGAGLRVPPLSPSPGRDGGQPQLLPPPRRAARGGQGARPPRGRDPRGHPPDSLVFEDEPLEELLATHPNFQGLDLPPSWQRLRPAWRRRWWACRATCRSIPAAWSSCPPRSPTTSPSSPR